ncbi:hypothetical protein BDFB_013205 [Asbolus verrucosus]|uniref:Serine protease gd N-terminal domain-containing protein n=1 Tax=Asbolus verrucosus TaxID=1661398 RepID=A0A482W3K8_ASBVE|nr:hypothetical protein BDFB_013205 [Asbolus verrucosus]
MFVELIGILVVVRSVFGQNPSPCPAIFSYEPRGQEQDRWYGVISLQTKDDLDGVWLKIILDRPAELLGNWFGEAVSSDNQEFTVKNPRYKLEAGPPVSVRFFVKYNAASTIPSLTSIKLNGKTVCTTSREEIMTTTPRLHISQVRPNRPNNKPAGRPVNNNNEGAFLNSRETSSQERPSSFGTSNNNVGGSSQERPLNNNYPNNQQ